MYRFRKITVLLLLAALLLMGVIPASAQEGEERFVLTFVGDCTLGSTVDLFYADLGFIKTVGDDYGYPFRNVQQFFSGDDGTFINLEGPLTDEGFPMEKVFAFRGPSKFINILTRCSVDAVSLANNHTRDYGTVGYESTQKLLQQAQIPYVEQDKSCIFTLDCGLTVGMYGMVYGRLDEEQMVQAVQALREEGAELVILAVHWGTEGSYRFCDVQQELAYAAIDAAVDIVWGTHPHVLQAIEQYGDGIIYYSLGNFSFGGNGGPSDSDSVLLQQEIIRSADGKVSLGELTAVPVCISSVAGYNNYQPTPYGENTEGYRRVMTKLGLDVE